MIRLLLPLLLSALACAGDAVLAERGGLQLAILPGDGAARGAAGGAALRDRTQHLLALVRISPAFHIDAVRRAALFDRLDADHRAELAGWAAAAGVAVDDLVGANLALDALCSVLVTGPAGDLRMARNMDFFPASALGSGTLLTLWRRPERRAVLGFGWPGYGGVVTGMNDAGVVGAVLQNEGNRGADTAGEPATFRIRGVLEHAADVAEAVRRCREQPVASAHFIVFADGREARKLWYDGTWHEVAFAAGRLTCTNATHDAAGQQRDERSAILAAVPGDADAAALRQALTAVHLARINAQAMVFRPARRSLQLALADWTQPAVHAPWRELDCGALLDGGAADTLAVTPVP